MLPFFIITLMLIINMTFLSIHHPLATTLLIVIQTILICLLMGPISYSFWFSYILFMIFLGGMLVLFIYITSLASNEMFTPPFKMISISTVLLSSTLLITFLFMKNNSVYPLNKQDSLISLILNSHLEMPKNLTQLYNYPNMNLTILSIIYLLLTLIVIVKITQIQEGPLRQLS